MSSLDAPQRPAYCCFPLDSQECYSPHCQCAPSETVTPPVKEPLTTAAEEYARKNPLGGPARVFEAMASRIRAGEDYYEVLADYGFQVVPEKRDATVPGAFDEALAMTRQAVEDTVGQPASATPRVECNLRGLKHLVPVQFAEFARELERELTALQHDVERAYNSLAKEVTESDRLRGELAEAKEKYRLLSAQHSRLCDQVYEEDGETLKHEAAESRVAALEKAIDGLIAYQFTGSSEAMNALQSLANLAKGKA